MLKLLFKSKDLSGSSEVAKSLSQLFYFTEGLRDETKFDVRKSKVHSLTEAIKIDSRFEECYGKRKEVTNVNYITKYPNQRNKNYKKRFESKFTSARRSTNFNNNNYRNNNNVDNNNNNYSNNYNNKKNFNKPEDKRQAYNKNVKYFI